MGRLEILRQALLKKGTPQIDTEVCYGVPFEEITRLIRERNVQLVVMGSQGAALSESFFWAVSVTMSCVSRSHRYC
jgi:nucleotide-binding universal stress UspA family protein